MRTGQVDITGPMTKEEKARWDCLKERKEECARSIAEDEQLLLDEPECEYKQQVLDNIKFEREIMEMISRVIPD